MTEEKEQFSLAYCNKCRLLTCLATGDMKARDFICLFESVKKYSGKTDKIKVLFDFRKMKINYPIKQQAKLIKPFKELMKCFTRVYAAHIVDTPIETAYYILFMDELNSISNLQFNIFSTKEAATQWLNNS